MKRILVLPGGGIRIILQALALAKLEEQTGKLTRESFDYVAGTSCGALAAGCIVAGVPASQILEIATKTGPRIFSPTIDLLRKFYLVEQGHMFDNRILNEVVRHTLGTNAGMTINDSPIGLLITAVDMGGRRWYFVRDNAKNKSITGKFGLADCMVASACAPTYHDSWAVTSPNGGTIDFFDGGAAGLADPVYHAAVEAFDYDYFDPANTKIVNLGTGRYIPATTPAGPTSLLDNISWVTSTLVTASRTEAQEVVDRNWPGITTLLNPELDQDIDEADVDSIDYLVSIGKQQADSLDWQKILGS
jgi:hypothetical protein